MEFSNRTDWPVTQNPLSQKLSSLREKGVSILDLTISNPTQCDFKYLTDKILKPFCHPDNLIYDPDPHGLLKSREAVCAHYAKKGIVLTPNQIFLTASTSEAYSFVFRLLANPHETVFAPQPSYPILDYLAGLNDVRLLRYPLIDGGSWKIDTEFLRRQTQSDPRAILVIHPNNPTGNYVSQGERLFLNELGASKEIAIISDEVFFEFKLHPKNPSPIESFAKNKAALTFTLGGISKIMGLPQMKLSWIIVTGPPKLQSKAIERLEIISDTYLSTSTPTQTALVSWFENQPKINQEILKRISDNHQCLAEKLGGANAIKVLDLEGGWHAILKMPPPLNDEDWALLLLEKDRVATHPGFLFDFEEGAYLVLSLLTKVEVFQEGVSRIKNRLEQGSNV